uniref:Uncharacterized protein n=1 Tax=Anguilla anguilla TaxID=7936 RepID=A0A0E9R301_ANGAN
MEIRTVCEHVLQLFNFLYSGGHLSSLLFQNLHFHFFFEARQMHIHC